MPQLAWLLGTDPPSALRLQVTRTWPMPRPAASRADAQMHGVRLTCPIPGHSW